MNTKYIVTDNNNNKSELSSDKLLELLLGNSLKYNKEKTENTVINGLLKSIMILCSTEIFANYTIISLANVIFNLGFSYSQFLKTNKIEIIEEK